MASVQVFILRSGRSDAYGLPLTPGSVVTVDRDYAVSLVSNGFASWMNPADAYDGETNLRKPSETYVLFQSGMPFAIFAGDGGSNGFNFTGTRGVFTLSAAAPFAGLGATLLSGCYAYIPAGAGGLAGGLYWCQMTDDTNGEIFAETYTPGSGTPKYITSPTRLPNCTSGRITQTTALITLASFTMPGGSLGPNGIMRSTKKWLSSSGASTKVVRINVGGQQHFSVHYTTTYNNQVVTSSRQNLGIETAQIGNRTSTVLGPWDAGPSAAAYSGDRTTIDTRVDQTVDFLGQILANTESLIIVPMQFAVQYGA